MSDKPFSLIQTTFHSFTHYLNKSARFIYNALLASNKEITTKQNRSCSSNSRSTSHMELVNGCQTALIIMSSHGGQGRKSKGQMRMYYVRIQRYRRSQLPCRVSQTKNTSFISCSATSCNCTVMVVVRKILMTNVRHVRVALQLKASWPAYV